MENVQLNELPDKLVWRWTADGTYTASSAYRMLHHGTTSSRGHRLVWKTWAPLRVRIFLWLALRRRHWAANRRGRHGLEARDTCFLCDQDQETIDHIIAACPFTRELLASHPRLQLPAGTASSLAWWQRIRSLTNVQWRKGLDTRDLLWSLGRFGKSGTQGASAKLRQQSSTCSNSSRWRLIDGLKRAQPGFQN